MQLGRHSCRTEQAAVVSFNFQSARDVFAEIHQALAVNVSKTSQPEKVEHIANSAPNIDRRPEQSKQGSHKVVALHAFKV